VIERVFIGVSWVRCQIVDEDFFFSIDSYDPSDFNSISKRRQKNDIPCCMILRCRESVICRDDDGSLLNCVNWIGATG
jgi:hypothetical protein